MIRWCLKRPDLSNFEDHRDKILGNNVTVVCFIKPVGRIFKSGQSDYSAMKPALSLKTEIPTFWIITAMYVVPFTSRTTQSPVE